MVIDPETSRGHRFDTLQAFIEFKHAITTATEKMVMMAFVRALVTWWLSGNFHRNHATIRREGSERSINCRQSNAGRVFERQLLDFRCG